LRVPIGPSPTLITVMVTVASALAPSRATPAFDAGHNVSFVDVGSNVSLEVLDWGGSGPSLILLAGLNNTAHVFYTFAPQLATRFHVRAITRRGFGGSSRPADEYDTDTLASDVVDVMNTLAIRRTVLVGHSIAGDELTAIAATQPERVQALVYIDAAYDRTTQPQSLPSPSQPRRLTIQGHWRRSKHGGRACSDGGFRRTKREHRSSSMLKDDHSEARSRRM